MRVEERAVNKGRPCPGQSDEKAPALHKRGRP